MPHFLSTLSWYLEVALVFVVMMTVLVAAHEYGHYLFARMFGMGIEEFAIGMGKRVTVWRTKTYDVPADPSETIPPEGTVVETGKPLVKQETTEFTIRALPVGGFVRIKGMIPEDDGSEVNVPGGFYSKAPWKRLLVLFAGPLFSVLAGIAVLVPVYSIWGIDKPDTSARIDKVVVGKAADRAGIKPGDLVESIDNKPIKKFIEMVDVVSTSAGKPLVFKVLRSGQEVSVTVTPESDKDAAVIKEDLLQTGERKTQGRIGVAWGFTTEHVSLGGAFKEAINLPITAVSGIVGMFRQPSTIQENVGGPATMVDVVAHSTEKGIDSLLVVAALLSISVGIMNLLPIPPLDGGQMVVAFAELLRGGRRLSMKVQLAVQNVGFTLVIVLIMSVLFVDFKRYVTPEKGQKFVQPDASASPSAAPTPAPAK